MMPCRPSRRKRVAVRGGVSHRAVPCRHITSCRVPWRPSASLPFPSGRVALHRVPREGAGRGGGGVIHNNNNNINNNNNNSNNTTTTTTNNNNNNNNNSNNNNNKHYKIIIGGGGASRAFAALGPDVAHGLAELRLIYIYIYIYR